MNSIRLAVEDLLSNIEFLMCRIRFELFKLIKPYRFAGKPMNGYIYKYINLENCRSGRIEEETAFVCTRCGLMQLSMFDRCPVCGQKLEWRQ